MEPGSQKHRHHRSPQLAMSAGTVSSDDPGPAAAAIAESADSGSAAGVAKAAHTVSLDDGRSPDYRYPGGKSLAGVHQWIVSLLPSHVWYAEPFVGHGGIFRHKPPALRSYLIDCDPAVIAWWHRRADPGAIVHCGDGIRWLQLAAQWAGPELLIYVDPPYLLSTRVKKRIYARELQILEHMEILAAVRKCNCPVAISGYPSGLYDAWLSTWSRFDREVITRGGVMRTECLWTNYDPGTASPALTMQYSALGPDFRERDRIARKIKRWVKRIQGLHRQERRALLLAILDAERGSRIGRSDEVAGIIVETGEGRGHRQR